ncbi:MAG: FxsA family protein [Deltaproteobacteria bacterium]|jgi:UPF0716 protein FxsA|nr:FxsA family protein [Deltaproteobacteria bacterium]
MPFFLVLLLFFLAELGVMSAVSGAIGFLSVLGLLFLGFMVGGYLLNRQGKLSGGKFTAYGPNSGSRGALGVIFNLLSGLLFIFPGFISDALALLLLLPPVRVLLIGLAGHLLLTRLASRVNRMQSFTFGRRYGAGGFGTNGFGTDGATGEGRTDGFGAGGFGAKGAGGTSGFGASGTSAGNRTRATKDEDTVIEGEFRDVTEEMRQPEKICSEKEQA